MKSDKEHRIDKDNVACVCKEMYIVIDISKVIGPGVKVQVKRLKINV